MLNIKLLLDDADRSLKNVPIEKLNNKHVLITGGSGLIGTHLLYGLYMCRLMGVNVDVTYTSNQYSPLHLLNLPFTNLTGENLINQESLRIRSVQMPKVDIIIHCATYGQPNKFLKNKVETIKLNTMTPMLLMEYLNPEKFLFLSTSELYSGLENVGGYSETQIGTTDPTHPRSCYIESKRCGESICNAFREQGIDAKSVRLCLAYGPGTKPKDDRVINSFIEKALKNHVINMMDNGESLRTYGYVSDCAYMIWRILLEGKHPVYNVGGVSNITIKELANMIGSITNSPVNLPEISKGLVGAPTSTQLNLSRFYNEFGNVEFLDMASGLNRTIEWQRGLYL